MGKVKKLLVFLLVAALTFGSLSVSAFAATKSSVQSVTITNVPYKVITLKKGAAYRVKTDVVTTGKASKELTFTTTNPKIVKVSQKGTIVAQNTAGSAFVYAVSKFDKTKKTVIKVVVGNPVTKVAINKSSAKVVLGKTTQLKAVVNASASVKGIHYFSSNTKVATVDPATGVVKGVKAGTATIYARAKDNSGKYAKCVVTVVGKVNKITVSNSQPVLTIKKGAGLTLKPVVSVTGSAVSKAVTFKTSNPNVVKVSKKGYVLGVANGTAYVTITSVADPTVKRVIKVYVGQPVTSVKLNKTATTIKLNSYTKLTATVAPAKATVNKIKWVSSNPNVAAVSQKGTVVAKGVGTAVITAASTDSSLKVAKCVVTVKGIVNTVSVTNVKNNALSLNAGNTFVLKPVVTVTGGISKAVSYSSSNKAVAKVDAAGKITAVGNGKAVITVASKYDPKIKTTVTITVKTPVKGIKLNKTSVKDMNVGGTTKLTATISPSTASNKKVVWSSSNTAVATVAADGTVKALKKGTAVITAKSAENGKILAKCTITVTYSLIFSDEFNGTELDKTKWSYETHEPGWVNNELQEYVEGTDNVYLKDGKLVIKPIKTVDKVGNVSYTSGRINTQNKFNFTYGKVEARLKFPEGKGYLPAFWMMPQEESLYGQWPKCGEIDIAEVLGHKTDTLYSTLHFGEPHDESQGSITLKEGTFSDSFHTVTCEWEPGSIKFYMDGKLIKENKDWFTASGNGEITYPAPFDQPFYLILNLAVGGNWPGNPDETTDFNQTFETDYVRVYQKDSYDENVTKPEKEEVKPREPQNGNYIYNGDFSSAKKGEFWGFKEALEGKAEFVVSNKELVVKTNNEGTVDYSVQVVQENVPLDQAGEYEISFDAYASEARDIYIGFSAPNRGWKKYFGNQKVELTAEKQTFRFNFTMDDKSDPQTNFEFNMGKCGSTATVHITNVKLTKISQGEVVEEGKTVLANGNYVYNGTFDQGENRLGFWDVKNISKSEYGVTNVNNIREFYAKTSSAEAQLAQDIAISGDKKYTLKFNAHAEKDREVTVVVANQKFNFDVTTENQEYAVDFNTASDIANAKIVILLAGEGKLFLDNISVMESGLVVNGDFSNGMVGWSEYIQSGEGVATIAVDSLTEPGTALDITIDNTGSANWHIQLNQDDVKLENGKWYRFSYDARTTYDAGRKMEGAVKHNGTAHGDDQWYEYSGNVKVDLTTEWQTFTSVFQMTEDDPVARIGFQMGNCDTQIAERHHIYIDNIVLEEVETSVIVNGDFSNGFEGWSAGGSAEGASAEWSIADGGAKVVISNVGTANYGVQLSQMVALEEGATYKISFDAVSEAARKIEIGLIQDQTWTYYGGGKFDLIEGDNHIEKEFTVDKSTADNILFQLNLGFIDSDEYSAATTVILKNIRFEKVLKKPIAPQDPGTQVLRYTDLSKDWSASVQGTAVGNASIADGKATYEITDIGTENWHVQLGQSGLQLDTGGTYEITFDVNSSVDRTLHFGFTNTKYDWYGGGKFDVTAGDNHITKEITVDMATADDIIFNINMGKLVREDGDDKDPVNAAGTFVISHISVVKMN